MSSVGNAGVPSRLSDDRAVVIYLQLIAGFILLILGGEALVRGAVSLARRLAVSPLLIGATVVAFGTSMPELVVSLGAVLKGNMGIAFGNVVGSNIANLLLILGIAAVISPVVVQRRAVARDVVALVLATIMLMGFVQFGRIVPWQGVLMLVLLGCLTTFSYWYERHCNRGAGVVHAEEAEARQTLPRHYWLSVLFVVLGLAAVAGGAHLLVDAATVVARAMGISDAVIGLTVVAVGSSLPELATTIVAAYRRHADVAFGNVIGSSVFNILAIIGFVSIVRTIEVPVEIMGFDIWVLLGVTAVVAFVALVGWRMNRAFGLTALMVYGAFLALQYEGSFKP